MCAQFFDFGRFYILNFVEAQAYPALDNVSATPGAEVELVDQQGAAKLLQDQGLLTMLRPPVTRAQHHSRRVRTPAVA